MSEMNREDMKAFADHGGVTETIYQEGTRGELGMIYGFCTVCGEARTSFTRWDGDGNVEMGMCCSGPERHEGW